jgi:hypothetical protein
MPIDYNDFNQKTSNQDPLIQKSISTIDDQIQKIMNDCKKYNREPQEKLDIFIDKLAFKDVVFLNIVETYNKAGWEVAICTSQLYGDRLIFAKKGYQFSEKDLNPDKFRTLDF